MLIEIASATAVILGVLVSVYRLWPLFKKGWNNIINHQVAVRLEEIANKVDANARQSESISQEVNSNIALVLKEVSFNNGTSIKDALSRIEARQLLATETQNSLMQLDHRGIFRADSSGNWKWVNGQLLDILGVRDSTQIHNRGWVSYVVSEDRDKVLHEYDAAVADNRHYRGQFKFHNQEANKDCVVQLDCFVLRGDDEKEILGFLGFVWEAE